MARRELGRWRTALATSPCALREGVHGRLHTHTSERLASALRCGVPRGHFFGTDARALLFSVPNPLRVHEPAARSDEGSPPTFTRYTHPYLPPKDRHRWPDAFRPMAEALARHDEDACWQLVQAYRESDTPMPYSLWHGVWLLIAQGPAPAPLADLYARLDRICERLGVLHKMHAQLFPEHDMPRILFARYVYLLLKRAERLDHAPAAEQAALRAERLRQARILHDAVRDAYAPLDTLLLGRVIYRLARLGLAAETAPLLDAFLARPDVAADAASAAQPLNAIAAACTGALGPGRVPGDLLKLATDAVRLAYERHFPIRGALVQTLLLRLGAERVEALLRACRAERVDAPPHVDLADWGTLLRRLAQTRPTYLAERCAVMLCRVGRPTPALGLIRSRAELPYDVYAAAISSLSWIARERRPGHDAAMQLALEVLEALHTHENADYGPDQQMYGELIRGLEATMGSGAAAAPDTALAALVAHPPDWPAELYALTAQILSRMYAQDVPLLLFAHHARLLAMNIQAEQFMPSRRLYEQARLQFPTQLPLAHRSGALLSRPLVWLFTQAAQRPGQLSFAVRLYHDAMSFGYVLPRHAVVLFVRALLAGGMPTVAQRTVLDVSMADYIPRASLAPGVLRAFFHAGHLEPALGLAETIYGPTSMPAPWEDQSVLRHAPLAMYGVCLYEASRTKLARHAPSRARLLALFDEFRLALAHALAHPDGDDVMPAVAQAYRGAVVLHLAAGTPRAEIESLLDELRDLDGDAAPLAALVSAP